MATSNPAEVMLSTGNVAKILGCSSKKVNDTCDLPSEHPARLPCTRSELTGNHRKVKLLDVARYIVAMKQEASALRFWDFARNTLLIAEEELRCYLLRNEVDVVLFPSGKETIFLICLPSREATRSEAAYCESVYRVDRFANVHDASLAMGTGIRPSLVVIDLGLAGTSAGLNFVQWLAARSDCPRLFTILPEDGIGGTLPEGIPSVQRPADTVGKILQTFPPASSGGTAPEHNNGKLLTDAV